MTKDIAPLLGELRSLLGELTFPLDLVSREDGREQCADLVAQLDDYILPRYESLDAPLLAVIGGSTGSGKSALTNSIIGENIARSTAIRPTTRRPLLICHPEDEGWFVDQRILPSLARVRGSDAESSAGELGLATSSSLPRGLAILDSPDIDSVVEENRRLAAQLLAAADLWVFVTTAARYADAIPWGLLDDAAERNIVIGVVLNRVPPGVSADVRADLDRRLDERGLGAAPLFVIGETELDGGLIPRGDVEPLRSWLTGLAHDSVARSAVARQTLRGAVDTIVDRSQALLPALDDQVHALVALAEQVDDAFAAAHSKILAQVSDGSVLRGEVLARWQDFVGTGDLLRTVEAQVGKVRDRITSWFRGNSKPAPEPVEDALEDGVAAMLTYHAENAIALIQRSWSRGLGGEELVGHTYVRSHAERHEAAIQTVRQWQNHLLELIKVQGESKRATARILALGLNTVGVALMIIIFASTAGLTGGEVVVAGSTAVIAQKLLEAIFGDDAVRKMAKEAREDLSGRAGSFLLTDAQPFRTKLGELNLDPSRRDNLAELTALLTGALAEARR